MWRLSSWLYVYSSVRWTSCCCASWCTAALHQRLLEANWKNYLAELLGEVVVADTKENLRVRVEAEYGATDGKLKLAKKAKELGLDAIHDTVHEMCKDEARHGKAFLGLLEKHFGSQN